MEIDWELKESKKLKEGNYQNITSKHLPAFINTLENTNKLVALYHPTPLPILKMGATLKEQAINFNIL